MGIHAWTQAEAQKSRDCLQICGPDFPFKKWLLTIEARDGLLQKILHRLATLSAQDPQEFQNQWRQKTSCDRERFWTSFAAEENNHSYSAVIQLLENPVELPEQGFPEHLIRLVFEILPDSSAPSLLLTASTYEEILEGGKTLVGWVEAVPQLTNVIVVTPEIWQAYLDRAPASRTKAILREGVQELPVTDSAMAAESLGRALGKTVPLSKVLPEGIDAPLLHAVQELAQVTSRCPQTEAENDLARSQAERTLFEFLERWPETAGRFAQNAQLDFQFGPRAAEIDLFSREARVAVEIDGYFHFQSDDAYRRDRAKDWELQRRGFLVLRFLANDILPRIDEIRDRIFAALAPSQRSLQR